MKKLNLKLLEWMAVKSLLSQTTHTVKLHHNIFESYHSGCMPEAVKRFIRAQVSFAITNGYYLTDYLTGKASKVEMAKKLGIHTADVIFSIGWFIKCGYVNNKSLMLKFKSKHLDHNIVIDGEMIAKLLVKYTKSGKPTVVFVKKLLKQQDFLERKKHQNYILSVFEKYSKLLVTRRHLSKEETSEYKKAKKAIMEYGGEYKEYGKSYATIAKQLKVCIATAYKYVNELVRCNIIEKFHQRIYMRTVDTLEAAKQLAKSASTFFQKRVFFRLNCFGKYDVYSIGANFYSFKR